MSSPIGQKISQTPTLPRTARSIVSIGAGGIVRDAHQPAYEKANFSVTGVFDPDLEKARKLAADFHIPRVFDSLPQAVEASEGAIFDVAVPASALLELLPQLPDGAHVLIQKPLGESLAEALAIRDLCRAKKLKAAVNFQLRYAPFVIGARHLIDSGAIGDLHSIDLRVTVQTPWQLWSFLQDIERLEILYHSIHYIDLVRSFFGEPKGVLAKTTKHPACPQLAPTRTGILFDYGEELAANIVTTHGHDFGQRHQESYIRWEGTCGAIVARMGVLMDYPTGTEDVLEYCSRQEGVSPEWVTVPLEGTWFPDAFVGTMASVMRQAEDPSQTAVTDVEDAFRTMAVVEAAYESSERGATPISSG